MLSFVNTQTQKKFVITHSLDKVCDELGWSKREVEQCGGVTQFMHKHEKVGTSLLIGDDDELLNNNNNNKMDVTSTTDANTDAI
jgi:hypothetical protein